MSTILDILNKINPPKPKIQYVSNQKLKEYSSVLDMLLNLSDLDAKSLEKNKNPMRDMMGSIPSLREDLSNLIDFHFPDTVADEQLVQSFENTLQKFNYIIDADKFKRRKDKICLISPDIVILDDTTLQNVCFGQFRIMMQKTAVFVQPYKNNKENDAGYIHPYVRDNILCLGDYKLSYKSAMRNNRISEAFSYIHDCLSTYNDNSKAYQKLNYWTGIKCVSCEDYSHDTITCVESGLAICRKCRPSCQDAVTKQFYIPTLLKECKSCKMNVRYVSDKNLCKSCLTKESVNDTAIETA